MGYSSAPRIATGVLHDGCKMAKTCACGARPSIRPANAADPAVERGKYLATISGCGDCHMPGHFLGRPDLSRELGGSDVGFEVRDLGVVYGPNLTMDRETGLDGWSDAQTAAAITTGTRPDGRKLAPMMPWRNQAALTKADVDALIAYLKSLPSVKNKVPSFCAIRDTDFRSS